MANEADLSDAFDFGMQDPNDIQNQQDAQYRNVMESPNATAVSRGFAGMNQGMDIARGGSPQVLRAQKMQAAMSQILQGVNDTGGDDEDPLSKQTRIAQAVVNRFSNIDPKIAMAANDRLVQLQQARTQQATLNIKEQEADLALKQQKLTGSSLNVAGFDPKSGEYKVYGTVDTSDPQAAQELAGYKQAAQKDGITAGIMSDEALSTGRQQIAYMKAQAGIQEAQIRANASTQAAMIRAAQAGQGMNGREAQMTQRILSSAELGSQAIQNITELPLGATTGILGVGSSPGSSIMQSTKDVLRNKLSDQETQSYNVMAAGLERNLAMLEMQGGLQGGQHFSEQIGSALKLREGDTAATVMQKLAEARQIIEVATKVYMANPKLPESVKDSVQESIDKLRGAVPFTVHDVTSFLAAQDKNPKLTLAGYAAQNGLGSTGAPTPSASVTSITTQAEYDALPKGASYTFNGKTGTKR